MLGMYPYFQSFQYLYQHESWLLSRFYTGIQHYHLAQNFRSLIRSPTSIWIYKTKIQQDIRPSAARVDTVGQRVHWRGTYFYDSNQPVPKYILDCILACVLSFRFAKTVHPMDVDIYSSWSRLSSDVVKSRIQLRPIPPTGTPIQYIASEIKTIIAESGTWVQFHVTLQSKFLLTDNVSMHVERACFVVFLPHVSL